MEVSQRKSTDDLRLLEGFFPKFPMADLNKSCIALSTLNLGKYGAIAD